MTPRGSRRTPPGGGTFQKTARAGQLHEVDETSRLAYTRKQAAEALGVSISTIAGASFLHQHRAGALRMNDADSHELRRTSRCERQ